jgi:hypothetical protein
MTAAALIGVPHKTLRVRRTKAEIKRLWTTMAEELAEHHPQSVRHLYYRMVVRDEVDKTEAGYASERHFLRQWAAQLGGAA